VFGLVLPAPVCSVVSARRPGPGGGGFLGWWVLRFGGWASLSVGSGSAGAGLVPGWWRVFSIFSSTKGVTTCHSHSFSRSSAFVVFCAAVALWVALGLLAWRWSSHPAPRPLFLSRLPASQVTCPGHRPFVRSAAAVAWSLLVSGRLRLSHPLPPPRRGGGHLQRGYTMHKLITFPHRPACRPCRRRLYSGPPVLVICPARSTAARAAAAFVPLGRPSSAGSLAPRWFQLPPAPLRHAAPWRVVAGCALGAGAASWQVRTSSRAFSRRVLSATFSAFAPAAAFAARWSPVVGVAVHLRRVGAAWAVSVPVL
jgi:hypothetical protein